jgi:thiamine biosynthesis lipoprotein
MVLGEHAVDWLEGRGLPARLVRLDGTVVYAGRWPTRNLSLAPELSTR